MAFMDELDRVLITTRMTGQLDMQNCGTVGRAIRALQKENGLADLTAQAARLPLVGNPGGNHLANARRTKRTIFLDQRDEEPLVEKLVRHARGIRRRGVHV